MKLLICIMSRRLIAFLADTIATKWRRAQDGIKETGLTYKELTDRLDKAWIEEWTRQEQVAMQNRGEDLKIYMVASELSKVAFHRYRYIHG